MDVWISLCYSFMQFPQLKICVDYKKMSLEGLQTTAENMFSVQRSFPVQGAKWNRVMAPDPRPHGIVHEFMEMWINSHQPPTFEVGAMPKNTVMHVTLMPKKNMHVTWAPDSSHLIIGQQQQQ